MFGNDYTVQNIQISLLVYYIKMYAFKTCNICFQISIFQIANQKAAIELLNYFRQWHNQHRVYRLLSGETTVKL